MKGMLFHKISANVILYVLLIAVCLSCNSQQRVTTQEKGTVEIKSGDSLFAALERSVCFGRCPAYLISIYSSGYVVYEGRQNVDHIGFFYTFITSKKREEISQMAKNIGFDELNDKYHDPNIVDAPSTFVSFKVNGKIKRIDDTYGDTPQRLTDFEKYLDEIFKETKWIKIKENK